MSPSPAPYLHLSPRVLQIFQFVLLILWCATFAAVHSLAFSLYVVPLLALITFFLLPSFPVVVTALFLSGYLDGISTDAIPQALRLLLIGAIWLAVLVALSTKAAVD